MMGVIAGVVCGTRIAMNRKRAILVCTQSARRVSPSGVRGLEISAPTRVFSVGQAGRARHLVNKLHTHTHTHTIQ